MQDMMQRVVGVFGFEAFLCFAVFWVVSMIWLLALGKAASDADDHYGE